MKMPGLKRTSTIQPTNDEDARLEENEHYRRMDLEQHGNWQPQSST
jgi:hypothetical protein